MFSGPMSCAHRVKLAATSNIDILIYLVTCCRNNAVNAYDEHVWG